MVGLKGHRSAGGIRVSMYNALDPSGIEKLVSFMRAFAKANG
jgi:phosphoserine aminotransferase